MVMAGVAGVVACWAVAGAIGLITGGIDMGAGIDRRLPLHSPVLAGALLTVFVAVPMGVTTVAAVRDGRWSGAAALVSGAVLVGWIAVQPVIIGQFSWLQPVFGVCGVIVASLGLYLRSQRA